METIRAAMTARLLGEASGPLAGIYVITHRATGKRYVGQSVNIRSRWTAHRHSDGDTRLARAIRRHGPDAFAFEIVELCTPEELNDREAFYVWAFDCLSPKGYNLQSGGGQGQVATEEVRAKIRDANVRHLTHLSTDPEMRAKRARAVKVAYDNPEFRSSHLARSRSVNAALWADPEFRAKVSESVRAATSRRWADPETRADLTWKIAESNRRKAQDPEYLAKIAVSNRCRRHTQEHVLIHTTTGAVERGLRWELIERLGLHQGNFSSLIHGRYKTVQGYRLARPEEIQ